MTTAALRSDATSGLRLLRAGTFLTFVGLLISSLMVAVAPVAPAAPAAKVIEFNSLELYYGGRADSANSNAYNDRNPGDGACQSIINTSVCTLRTALSEANGTSGSNPIVIQPAANLLAMESPRIVLPTYSTVSSGTGTSRVYKHFMVYDTSITPDEDYGAYFHITRANVTVDFLTRVGITTNVDTANGVGIYVDAPGVTLRNMALIQTSETAIAVSNAADDLTMSSMVLDNPKADDASGYAMERGVYFQAGTDANPTERVTLQTVSIPRAYGAESNTGAVVFADGAKVKDLTLDNFTVDTPVNSQSNCNFSCDARARPFKAYATGSSVTLTDLVITNSLFRNVTVGLGVLDFGRMTVNGATITNNTFSGNSVSAIDSADSTKWSNTRISGNQFVDQYTNTSVIDFYTEGGTLTNVTVEDNQFLRNRGDSETTATIFVRQATIGGTSGLIIRNNLLVGGSASASPDRGSNVGMYIDPIITSSPTYPTMRIYGNRFDNYEFNAIRNYRTSYYLFDQNLMGASTYSTGTESAEVGQTGAPATNYDGYANNNVRTWYPTGTPTVDNAACEVTVNVTPNTSGNSPDTSKLIDVYWTATNKAEVYLGRQAVNSTSATAITVPYYQNSAGYLRVQTLDKIDANGVARRSSQYSRTVKVAGNTCVSKVPVTISKAAGQADPALMRDIHFTATFDKPMYTQSLTAGDFDVSGGTVSSITETAPGVYDVVVRTSASSAGTVTLSLPEGKVNGVAGTAANTNEVNAASNQATVAFQSPWTRSPGGFALAETSDDHADSRCETYSITRIIPAADGSTTTVAITPSPAEHVTISPASPVTISNQDAVTTQAIVVCATDDDDAADKTVTLNHAITSTDPNLAGWNLDPVTVTIADDDSATAASVTIKKTGPATVTGAGTGAWSITDYGTNPPTPATVSPGTFYWAYRVTNTGGTTLTDIRVTDNDPTVTVHCPATTLGVGQSFYCYGVGRIGPKWLD